jgi:hypothetical protein
MNLKTAKKILANINYSQGRNRVSNRPVKEISLTPDVLVSKFNEQDGKCFWSKLPLSEEFNYIKHHPFAISADRLDNNKGYTYENTVLTRRLFNLGRMAFPEKDFKEVITMLKQEFAPR